MKKIGKMWRNFKNRLTREIYNNVKEDINPESFAESHEDEYGIPKDDWIKYVKKRLSSEFAVSYYVTIFLKYNLVLTIYVLT